jgi:hypothetical protein
MSVKALYRAGVTIYIVKYNEFELYIEKTRKGLVLIYINRDILDHTRSLFKDVNMDARETIMSIIFNANDVKIHNYNEEV